MEFIAFSQSRRAVRFWVCQLIAVLTLVGASVAPCDAEVLAWNFSGRLNSVPPELAGSFAVGDVAMFTVAFETTTPPSGPTGATTYPGAITSLSAQLGSYVATMTSSPSWNFIIVFDNWTGGFFPLFDGITFSAPVSGAPVGGFTPDFLQIHFGDITGSALSSTALPSLPPNLSTFSPGFVNFNLFFLGSVAVSGEILAVTAVPTSFQVCPLYDQTKAVKSGATVPIKLALCGADGSNQSSSSIVVTAASLTQVSTGAPGDVADAGNANPDNNFRFDSALAVGGAYIFNLKTTGLGTGTYNLNFFATGDAMMHAVQFQVK